MSQVYNIVIHNWFPRWCQWQRTCLPMQEIQESRVWSLAEENSLEEDIETHSSILAWRIPWTEDSGGLWSIGLWRVGHNWSDLACTLAYSISSHYKMLTIFPMLYNIFCRFFKIYIYIIVCTSNPPPIFCPSPFLLPVVTTGLFSVCISLFFCLFVCYIH